MVFVFIALILSLALIPLVLIDMRIKVSETQFDLAIRSLESPEDKLAMKAEKRMIRKQRVAQLKSINWNTGRIRLKNIVLNAAKTAKNILINGNTTIKERSKSLIAKMKEPWTKVHQLIKSKNSRTNRNTKNPTTRTTRR